MTTRSQVFRCELCGNVVEVVGGGQGKLACCGQPMNLMSENTVDASREKHLPVLQRIEGGIGVSVGSITHPMEDNHYIEWIEIIADDKVYRKYLQLGEEPTAVFPIIAELVTARAYCNIHGIWRG